MTADEIVAALARCSSTAVLTDRGWLCPLCKRVGEHWWNNLHADSCPWLAAQAYIAERDMRAYFEPRPYCHSVVSSMGVKHEPGCPALGADHPLAKGEVTHAEK